MRIWKSLILLGGLLVACDSGSSGASGETGVDSSTTPSDPGGTGEGTTTADPSAGTTTSGPTSTTSAPSGDSTSGGNEDDPMPPVIFDFGGIPDVGELDDGCNAVDFLFVIDNSGSMGTAQANLVANFPAFIDGIQNTLTDVQSYHVGIVSSDAYAGNPTQCRQLGALITSTAGADSSAATCGPYSEGYNFITEEDDLTTAFQCAARVGTVGDFSELPMNAMEAAIGETLNAEGACNEGFIRDNALLVVVIITDEPDGPGDYDGNPPNTSTGTPMTWYESVVAAKNDTPENAAALVLTNYDGGPCPGDGDNLVEFAGLFGENGFTAGICEPDYGPSFANATAVIQQACENFIPPG